MELPPWNGRNGRVVYQQVPVLNNCLEVRVVLVTPVQSERFVVVNSVLIGHVCAPPRFLVYPTDRIFIQLYSDTCSRSHAATS